MQTFLPYLEFDRTAKCLDYRRLGKQRVECKQILRALYEGSRWTNHPATRMWAGFELALSEYYNSIVREWIRRGYKNNMPLISLKNQKISYPTWLGNEKFHESHQSNLLRKDPKYYSQFQWKVNSNLSYIWP